MKKHQIQNLQKLYDYLLTLPKGYNHFNMNYYFFDGDEGTGCMPSDVTKKVMNKCGTSACILGHGPLAGVRPKRDEYWRLYAGRAFGAFCRTKTGKTVYDRIFDEDNSPRLSDGIRRLKTLLKELQS
jgi:hypothetical protein